MADKKEILVVPVGVNQALENFAHHAKEMTKQHESGLITHYELFMGLTSLVQSNWLDSTGTGGLMYDQNTGLSLMRKGKKT